MKFSVRYRLMKSGDEKEISELVSRSFIDFVAPKYNHRAVQEFLENTRPEFLLKRSQTNHFVLTAFMEKKIVGMIEIRDHNHISMLFVDKGFTSEALQKNLSKERCPYLA